MANARLGWLDREYADLESLYKQSVINTNNLIKEFFGVAIVTLQE